MEGRRGRRPSRKLPPPHNPRYANPTTAAIITYVNPSLYQINTKALLSSIGKGATLDDIPNSFLDSLALQGFDWLWPLGVWRIGPTGRDISRSNKDWHKEYEEALPDFSEEDICGSPFAVCDYTVAPELGGDAALARLRERLEQRGIDLLLDFVPNHIGFDHPWVTNRPDFLIKGTQDDLKQDPGRWAKTRDGQVFAFGRDPNYPGWPDTLQLNYFNPQLRSAVVGQLRSIATRCGGVRCDMAMLLEPEIFAETWGSTVHPDEPIPLFWPEAIQAVKRDHPRFMFLAEVYWNYEKKLQEHGFDYTYDKTLYDQLVHHQPQAALDSLRAPREYQSRMARFLENHDEARISAKLCDAEHRAAATIIGLAPGLRFFHHGQFKGSRVRVPVHLRRGPHEEANPELVAFYQKLIPIVNSQIGKHGNWSLLTCAEAWPSNPTHNNFISYCVEHEGELLLVAVNYAPYQGQCYVKLSNTIGLKGPLVLQDKLSDARYTREGGKLSSEGLYLDVPGFTTHIFSVRAA